MRKHRNNIKLKIKQLAASAKILSNFYLKKILCWNGLKNLSSHFAPMVGDGSKTNLSSLVKTDEMSGNYVIWGQKLPLHQAARWPLSMSGNNNHHNLKIHY